MTTPRPAVDYTDKDFASLRAAMLRLAEARLPEWTDRSPADLGMLLDCPRLVCRGGEVILREGWGFTDENTDAVPAVLLTGGTLTANVWMPENIVYQLWEGAITAPGIRYWPETQVLSDAVTIVDPLDAEAADE